MCIAVAAYNYQEIERQRLLARYQTRVTPKDTPSLQLPGRSNKNNPLAVSAPHARSLRQIKDVHYLPESRIQ
jgi:hypothetical protein